MKKRTVVLSLMIILAGATLGLANEQYSLDTAHTTIGFKVRHLGISDVKGKFDKFDGQLNFDGDKLISLNGTVDISSVNTSEPKRDAHLKSDDFFSAEKYPSMIFKSTKITQEGNNLAVFGELTIRDVTKTVLLNGEWRGFADMEMGGMKVHKTGLILEGDINRKDFGLAFNMMNGAGQMIVDDKVYLTIEIEGNLETGM